MITEFLRNLLYAVQNICEGTAAAVSLVAAPDDYVPSEMLQANILTTVMGNTGLSTVKRSTWFGFSFSDL
jgi:hypothetical protein